MPLIPTPTSVAPPPIAKVVSAEPSFTNRVEHPVTEWIAEINLPRNTSCGWNGIPLWQIPGRGNPNLRRNPSSVKGITPQTEIRRFYGLDNSEGYDSWKTTSINASPFNFDKAESIGPEGHCVVAYFSLKSRGGIHEFSDSQFGRFRIWRVKNVDFCKYGHGHNALLSTVKILAQLWV
nr:hypothetical protein [Tanacetum cinerariifolium]